MPVVLRPRTSPPRTLKVQCACLLPKLRLIPEFEAWLDQLVKSALYSYDRPVPLLWDCLALGAPLCTLLDLLGSPPGVYLDAGQSSYSGYAAEDTESHAYISRFIQSVRVLEIQGRILYGEVFRVDDLFGGTFLGFAKVLRTVERIVNALETTYPGIYVMPLESASRRNELNFELLHSEQTHIINTISLAESALALSDVFETQDKSFHCLAENYGRILQYHHYVFGNLEDAFVRSVSDQNWACILALDEDIFVRALAAYKSICAQYLHIMGLLDRKMKPIAAIHANTMHTLLSLSLGRMSDYQRLLRAILDVSNPTEYSWHYSLCLAVLRLDDSVQGIAELSFQARTMWTKSAITPCAPVLGTIHPDNFGDFLLDDCFWDQGSGSYLYMILFEDTLLCCKHRGKLASSSPRSARYPILPWEIGPAMKQVASLSVLSSIPTRALKDMRSIALEVIEIDWEAGDGTIHTLALACIMPSQLYQWQSTLGLRFPHLLSAELESFVVSGNDLIISRKAWSTMARKGTKSESSSLLQQEQDLALSPRLLPTLFDGIVKVGSPKSSVNDLLPFEYAEHSLPPTPPPESSETVEQASVYIPDLTGEITRDGSYPVAHGGFADVWKATWNKPSGDCKVAVKVLRSRIDNPEIEEKMKKRYRRELSVWQRLKHENILPLYGTTSDFGHYNSMVCPWMENGSVSKYMEMRGDILTLVDRLQLLCEAAAGLSYLHSFDVVHGDLTGSNILIDNEGKARLCDFGLSNIVAEFQGVSCLTSSFGGSVRWAAAEFYQLDDDDEDNEENRLPVVNTQSDIYSFGSVMLEILSGRIPYHYVKSDAQVVIELHRGNKPRRPLDSSMTTAHWEFIQRCWADAGDRPNAKEVCRFMQFFSKSARENRRHTA